MRYLAWGIPPDVTTLIVVWLGLKTELYLGVSGAFVLGFVEDGLTLSPAGFYPLILIISVILIKLLMNIFDMNRTFIKMALVFFIYCLNHIVFYPIVMYLYMGDNPIRFISHQFTLYCAQGFLTAICMFLFFRLFDRTALLKETGDALGRS
jgi:cell shape-determining protein MreD